MAYSDMIAAQTGASGGIWTHTPVDWAGNEGLSKPGGWPTDAAAAVPPAGARPGQVPPVAEAIIIIVGTVTGISATGATINWTIGTVSASPNSQVEFGPTTSYGTTRPVSALVGTGPQSTALTGLTTATVYHARIKASAAGVGAYSADFTFTTS
jgi:hypothetical protein